MAFPWIFKKIKKYKKTGSIDVIIISIIFFGTLIPMFFIQKGNSWNAIQFFYYSLVFLSVASGVVAGEYFEKRKRGWGGIILLITLLTIPTTIATLRHYLPSRPPSMTSNEELSALKFLKDQPDGIVLTMPFDKNLADKEIYNPPRPLYLYESTAYVSALTGKLTYFEDEVNLDITGYNWKDRKEEILKNITNLAYLKHIGIDYIYVTPTQKFVGINIFEGNIIYNDNGYLIIKI